LSVPYAGTDAAQKERCGVGCLERPGAGEAAGFLNPMGEGISAAMESGYQAAQAAAAHFDRPQAVLAAYREGTKALFDYMKRQWHLTAGLSESFGEMRLPQI